MPILRRQRRRAMAFYVNTSKQVDDNDRLGLCERAAETRLQETIRKALEYGVESKTVVTACDLGTHIEKRVGDLKDRSAPKDG